MRLTRLICAVAALSMAAAPAFAGPANPAAKLSLNNSNVRAGAPMKRKSKAISSGLLIGIVVAGGVIGGAIAISNSGSKPASA